VLVAGAFGARGARVVRSGAGTLGRRLDARFGAANRPPTGSILRKFTHLGAAGPGLRLRAIAVAPAGGGLAEGARRVGGGGKRESAGEQGEIESDPDGKATETAKQRRVHT